MQPNGDSSAPSINRTLLFGVANWALLISGVANLIVGTIAAFNETASIAATSLTAGLVLLFAATIDRFESLKGLGIEAKTKKLDEKIIQADGALRRLREMAEITGSALINLNSKTGRWDSALRPRESIEFAAQIRQLMKDLGSDERVIANALGPWAKTLCFDIAIVKVQKLRELLQKRISELEAKRLVVGAAIQTDDSELPAIDSEIRSMKMFIDGPLKKLHLLELMDYPEKFMEIFTHVPGIDAESLEEVRIDAGRFTAGMNSLKSTQTLSESELWIETLQRARE